MGDPSMRTLEAFAALRAESERTQDLEGTLDRAGLDAAAWKALERHWQSALARDIARGGEELVARYHAAFSAAPQRPPEAQVPTYLAARPPEPPPLAPSVAASSAASGQPAARVVRGTVAAADVDRALPEKAPMPFRPGLALPVRGAGRPVEIRAADPDRGQTVAPNSRVLAAPVTPFEMRANQADSDDDMPLERYARVTAMLANEGDPETTFARLKLEPARWMQIVRRFSARFAEDQALKSRFDELMAQSPAQATPSSLLRTTAPPETSTPRAALPFHGKSVAPPPSRPSFRAEGTGTAFLPDGGIEIDTGPEVPQGLPRLRVDQYAWISATLRRASDDEIGATLARFRLTRATFADLDAHWRAYLARNAGAMATYERALKQYVSFPR